MNKSELLAQISALEEALTNKGTTFVKADTSGTNAELEKEIERLELLIDDDGSTGGDGATDGNGEGDEQLQEDQGGTLVAEVEKKRVKIAKGVNVEMTHNGMKGILHSEKTYTLPADRATSLVAEKLGEFVDE